MSTAEEVTHAGITAATAFSKRQLDRVFSPGERPNAGYRALDWSNSFAKNRPLLFTFLGLQFFFALLPLVVFVSFAVSTTLFALVTAAVFSLFWIGVALVFLVPTLCITGSVAALAWLWITLAVAFADWVYNIFLAKPAVNGNSVRHASPPPSASHKQVPGPSRGRTRREHPIGPGAYVESDPNDKDALVKPEHGDSA